MKKRKILSLLLSACLLIALSGCETLGWANPFSEGNRYYGFGKDSWDEENPSEAFRYVSEAISLDDAHYPSYKFFIENYDEGIALIDAKIAEYENSSNIEDWVVLEDIYYNLKEFYGNLPGDPIVLTYKDQQLSIPKRDYTEIREGFDARAFEVGMLDGQTLLDAKEWRAANIAFEITVREFTESDVKEEVELTISNYMADSLELVLENITFDDLDGAGELSGYAMDFTETERIINLVAQVGEAGINLVFAESDQKAALGTETGLLEAIETAKLAYNYTSDREPVNTKILGYASRVAAIYDQRVVAKERNYNGSKTRAAEVYEAYGVLNDWVNDSYEALGEEEYSDLTERLADFSTDAMTRVYAVFDNSFNSGIQESFLSSLRDATAAKTNQFYWFFTSAEKTEMNGWRTSFGLTHVSASKGSAVPFQEVMPDYNSQLDEMDSLSRLSEAEALDMDYFAIISADKGRESSEIVTSTSRGSLTYYIQDGEVKDDKSTLDSLAVMELLDSEATTQYMEDEGIHWVKDNEYVETFAQAVTTQNVTFSITVFDVESGRRVYTTSDTVQVQRRSNRVRIGIDDINVWHFESLVGPSSNPRPEAVDISASDISNALVNNTNFNQIAGSLLQ